MHTIYILYIYETQKYLMSWGVLSSLPGPVVAVVVVSAHHGGWGGVPPLQTTSSDDDVK